MRKHKTSRKGTTTKGKKKSIRKKIYPSSDKPKMMLFGDSITEWAFDPKYHGWGSALAHKYARYMDIINRGYAGYNTTLGVPLLKRVLNDDSLIDILVIFFGANDASIETLTSVPLNKYRDNLTAMVNYAKSKIKNIKIILITPPPVHEKTRRKNALKEGFIKGDQPSPNNTKNVIEYAEVIKELGKTYGIPVVDLWLSNNKNSFLPVRSKDFIDGLHLSELGNKKLFSILEEVMISNWSGMFIPKSKLERQFPKWSDTIKDPRDILTWTPDGNKSN